MFVDLFICVLCVGRREKREEYQLRHIEKEDSPEVLKEKCSQLAQVGSQN